MLRAACRAVVFALALLTAVQFASPSHAAPPENPDRVSYQALLLDDLGAPRTGSVDLTVRIYDALTGGSLVYLQTYSAVALSDGVFSIEIGPAGEATDSPDDPLSTNLVDALSADVGAAGPDRFLELSVETESPLTRTQILTVPYALRAASAAQADVADSALEVVSVNGLPPSVLSEIFEHTNLDGVGPPNTDPAEGIGDTDGDGIANFVDTDNDNDQIDDGTEVSQGSNINLVTPTITGFAPPDADGFETTTSVTVSGTNFESGLGVTFGSQSPIPTNVTSSSFDVLVGPQAEGLASVVVTNPNGENDTESFPFFFVVPAIANFAPTSGPVSTTTRLTVNGSNFAPGLTATLGTEEIFPENVTPTHFEVDVGPWPGSEVVPLRVENPNGKAAPGVNNFWFFVAVPSISSISPQSGFASQVTRVTVSGQNFLPGLTVDFGSQSPTPLNLTSTRFEIDVGPQTAGIVDLTVNNPNGQSDLLASAFSFGQVDHTVATGPKTQLSLGVKGTLQSVVGGQSEYAVDTDTSLPPDTIFSFPTDGSSGTIPGQLAVGWAPDGTLTGIRCRNTSASSCDVEVVSDIDGDFDLLDETPTVVETIGGTFHRMLSTSLDFDSSGNVAAGYLTFSTSTASVVIHDRDGDGAFTGSNERIVIDTNTGSSADLSELAVDGSDRVAFVYYAAQSDEIVVLWDRSGDGDFGDTVGANPEESALLVTATAPTCLGAAFAPDGDLAVAYDLGAGPVLARDLNADGDFTDAGEVLPLDTTAATVCDIESEAGSPLSVAHNADGSLRLLVDLNDDGDFDDANENTQLAAAAGGQTHIAIGVADNQSMLVASETEIVGPAP